jgi:hypothetical protein
MARVPNWKEALRKPGSQEARKPGSLGMAIVELRGSIRFFLLSWLP